MGACMRVVSCEGAAGRASGPAEFPLNDRREKGCRCLTFSERAVDGAERAIYGLDGTLSGCGLPDADLHSDGSCACDPRAAASRCDSAAGRALPSPPARDLRMDTRCPFAISSSSARDLRSVGRHCRQAARPRLPGARAGRARQLDLPFSAADGVLHDAGTARDWRAAVRLALREADARRGAELLPQGGRHVRSADRVRREGAVDRSWSRTQARRAGDAGACSSVETRVGAGVRRVRQRAQRHARHRLLRSAEPAERARRGSAARAPLLQRAASLLPAARRGRRRRQLGGRIGARAVPRRRVTSRWCIAGPS